MNADACLRSDWQARCSVRFRKSAAGRFLIPGNAMDHLQDTGGRTANSEGTLARRAATVVGIAATYAVAIWLLWYARDIFLVAFAGILLAVFLNALAGWLSAHSPIPYGWAVALVVIGPLVLLGLIGWLLEQRLAGELQQFQKQIPTSWEQVKTQLQKSTWGQWIVSRLPEWKTVRAQLVSFSRMTRVLTTALGAIVSALIVLFAGLYGAAQPGLYRGGLLRLVAPAKRERAREVLDALAYNMRWWLIGQLISMTCVGVLVGLGMWLLGVPLPLTLALIAFVLDWSSSPTSVRFWPPFPRCCSPGDTAASRSRSGLCSSISPSRCLSRT